MSSTPTPVLTPTVTISQELLTDLHNGLHKLVYAHLGVIILLISLVGVGGYFGVRSYDKQLERAETLQAQFLTVEAQYTASQKQLTDLLASDAMERQAQSAQQAKLEAQIAQRDSQLQKPVVTQALTKNANSIQVAEGLQSAYSFQTLPEVTSDGKVAVIASEAQEEVLAKVNADRFSADLTDETQLYSLEKDKNLSLSNDLGQCLTTKKDEDAALTAAKKSLAAYEKVAHQSRFRKVLGSIGRNTERVAILVVGVELGRKL